MCVCVCVCVCCAGRYLVSLRCSYNTQYQHGLLSPLSYRRLITAIKTAIDHANDGQGIDQDTAFPEGLPLFLERLGAAGDKPGEDAAIAQTKKFEWGWLREMGFLELPIWLRLLQVLIESSCLDSLGVSKKWRTKLVKRWTRSEHARMMEIALAVSRAHEDTLRCERAQFENDELNTPTVVKEILAASQAIKEMAENSYANMQYDMPDISCAVRTRQSCQLMLSEVEKEVGTLFKTAQINEAEFEHYEHMLFHKRLHLTHVLPRVNGGEDGSNLLTYYFSDDDLKMLLSEEILERLDFKPSSEICTHKDAADCVYFISHGMARICKDAGVGRNPTQLLNETITLGAGARFGGAKDGAAAAREEEDEGVWSSATVQSEVVMLSTHPLASDGPDFEDSAGDIFRPAASSPEAVALAQSAGVSVAAVSMPAREQSSMSMSNSMSGNKHNQSLKNEAKEGENELLIGAGCCFNDIAFLVKDATGFESDNFGQLTTVTDVRCFSLNFEALRCMPLQYRNFLERMWQVSGQSASEVLLNHAPPEDWIWSSVVMEEYTENTQLQLSSCILLISGEIEQKNTKRRGSSSSLGNDEPPLTLQVLLHEAVSFIFPSHGDMFTVRSSQCKVLCQQDSKCTIIAKESQGKLLRQLSRQSSVTRRKSAVERRTAEFTRVLHDVSERLPASHQSRHGGRRRQSEPFVRIPSSDDQFAFQHKSAQRVETYDSSSIRVPPSPIKFLRQDSIPEHTELVQPLPDAQTPGVTGEAADVEFGGDASGSVALRVGTAVKAGHRNGQLKKLLNEDLITQGEYDAHALAEPADRLRVLKEVHAQKLITQGEYDAQRAAIIAYI